MKEKSIFIAMPCLGGVNPEVVNSVFENMTSFANKEGGNLREKIEIRSIVGSLIYDARNTLVKTFLEETNKTHFFFWDSDVILFDDTLNKLISYDLDVVSLVYYSKQAPHHPVFGAERVEVNENKIGTYKITNNAYLENEIQKVWGVGLGGCLIKREVLLKMMEEYDNPFFPFRALGEDYAFCERLAEQGFEVNIAPKIRTFHIGINYYQVDNYEKQLKMHLSKQINDKTNRMREEANADG